MSASRTQSKTRKPTRKTTPTHRSTLSLQKTTIVINVYDLLPAGKLSSFLWTVGASLLHSGVVIADKEYAFGGHDRKGMTGVYWTRPKTEPPGGSFKCELLHGFTISPQQEIDAIIREASEVFTGTSYNLLNKNCNHFTSYLCERLTGQPGPSWLNRAASIGVALPCVVPKEWITPPDYETADGDLVDEDDSEPDSGERSAMIGHREASRERHSFDDGRRLGVGPIDEDGDDVGEDARGRKGKGKVKVVVRDTSGRVVPPAEIAPLAQP